MINWNIEPEFIGLIKANFTNRPEGNMNNHPKNQGRSIKKTLSVAQVIELDHECTQRGVKMTHRMIVERFGGSFSTINNLLREMQGRK
jgi:hypothetical protein